MKQVFEFSKTIVTGYQVALDNCFSLMESFELNP